MIVWLSSYPRSGNTFFRVVLNSVFGIKTYSIYNDTSDIGADEATSAIVGHEFLPKDFDLEKASTSKDTYYIKTHELLENMVLHDSDKVIYLVRDGRESTLSFTKYLKDFHGKGDDDLSDVIYGNTPFGSWGEHVSQWQDVDKLQIKFEEMTDDPSSKLKEIADFLNIEPLNKKIPTFKELQKINPKFFRSGSKSSWKEHFSEMEHLAFWLRNYEQMISFGYTNDMPSEVGNSFFKTCISLLDAERNAIKNNTANDKLMIKKISIQDQKLNALTIKINKITTAIDNVAKIKFIKNPFKKYQSYKNMIKVYYKILHK